MKTLVRNVEQLEYLQVQAATANPNRAEISRLTAERDRIEAQLLNLRSEEEKALSLEAYFKRNEETARIIDNMDDETFLNRILEDVMGEMNTNSLQYGLCVELLKRGGFDLTEF